MHEMIKSTDKKEKKKEVALKASTHDDDDDRVEDEEVAPLSCMYKQFLMRRREGITKDPQ